MKPDLSKNKACFVGEQSPLCLETKPALFGNKARFILKI